MLVRDGRGEQVTEQCRAFTSAGAEIVPYTIDDKPTKNFKMVAVLQPDGRSTIEPKPSHCIAAYHIDTDPVKALLHSLGYLQDPDDALLPAIASFYHANELGPLTVWPAKYAYFSAFEVISEPAQLFMAKGSRQPYLCCPARFVSRIYEPSGPNPPRQCSMYEDCKGRWQRACEAILGEARLLGR